MKLTTEYLSQFIRGPREITGQLEVANKENGTVYRGDIFSATITGNWLNKVLNVSLVWNSQSVVDSSGKTRWDNSDNLEYEAKLRGARILAPNRTLRISLANGDTAIFFLPGVSRLDPYDVDGLIVDEVEGEDEKKGLSWDDIDLE